MRARDLSYPDDRYPSGLHGTMTGEVVQINGEPYVSLRHATALFEHTTEGIAFYHLHWKFLTWNWKRRPRLMFFEVVGEDRPQQLLEREFGKLPL